MPANHRVPDLDLGVLVLPAGRGLRQYPPRLVLRILQSQITESGGCQAETAITRASRKAASSKANRTASVDRAEPSAPTTTWGGAGVTGSGSRTTTTGHGACVTSGFPTDSRLNRSRTMPRCREPMTTMALPAARARGDHGEPRTPSGGEVPRVLQHRRVGGTGRRAPRRPGRAQLGGPALQSGAGLAPGVASTPTTTAPRTCDVLMPVFLISARCTAVRASVPVVDALPPLRASHLGDARPIPVFIP
ncbi:hypothetical protein GCM10010254_21410 [Streptomyces chromofuscus]|nr:hypothetical protein GCM10010254_21410 [Streptomyces chromofuscus]